MSYLGLNNSSDGIKFRLLDFTDCGMIGKKQNPSLVYKDVMLVTSLYPRRQNKTYKISVNDSIWAVLVNGSGILITKATAQISHLILIK